MKIKKRIANVIRLIARIWGSGVLLILVVSLFMQIIGAIVGSGEYGEGGLELNSARGILTFLCFPVGIMVGLATAWKWEGLGGLITTCSIICLSLFRLDLFRELWIVGMGVIGLMFVAYWALTRNSQVATTKPLKTQRNTRSIDIIIAVLISLIPAAIFVFMRFTMQQ